MIRNKSQKHSVSFLLLIFLSACASSNSPSTRSPLPNIPTPASPTRAANTSSAPGPTAIPSAVHSANASSFPDPSSYRWVPLISGMAKPTDIQFPDDGSGRMFVIEQGGRIRIIENGQMLDPPFLDITDRVGSQGDEQGLLGLAFHPDFKHNPYFYVNYTDLNGNTVIARFTSNGNTADPASEKDLLHNQKSFPNHNGGQMTFGRDGFLYLGLGDGGSQGDPFGNGQNKNVLFAKILRLDVDHGDPYSIPPGNPFAKGGGRPETWAYGLRNPWRLSFDQGGGNLYIADVGQDLWEEVDVVPAGSGGLNFGWNYYEGTHPYSGVPPAGASFTMPVVEYNHAVGGCAVVGGYVYRGAMAEWNGIYLYGDFCSGFIWGMFEANNTWSSRILFRIGENITTFGQDPLGEIYFAGRAGTIYRLAK